MNGEAAFESCDISGGQRIGQVKPGEDADSHTGVITLPPALLSIDDNYFLGAYIYRILLIHISRYIELGPLAIAWQPVIVIKRLIEKYFPSKLLYQRI